PPFSGFFSKDEILGHAYEHNKLYWILGVIGSIMTAIYMFRLYYLTFHGKFRGTHDQEHHLHESPKSMTIPLVILAVLAAFGGFVGIPNVNQHLLYNFLQPAFSSASVWIDDAPGHFSMTEALLMIVAVFFASVAIGVAYWIYRKKNFVPVQSELEMPKFQKIVYHKYYVDEFYNAVIRKPMDWIADKGYKWFELKVVDAFVNFVGTAVKWSGGVIRLAQSGNIGFYMFAMTIAIIIMLLVKLF
ncbi:MAG TPA: NADH-quinone oxidoreductase subunit L, partial [Bacteroidia bacterium]|nr:NADH-quinone oxidoreductase subunit L [Bacteroidia bacterium]